MKYRGLFKKWYFWGAVILNFILEIINYRTEFGKMYLTEYIGLFLGSLIVIWFIASGLYLIIWGLVNIFGKKKR